MHISSFEKVLEEFKEFLTINLRLAPSTVQNTLEDVKRFLGSSNYYVSYDAVKAYLKRYLDKAAKTYNSQITSLRRFVKVFLHRPDLIESFKMAPVDQAYVYTDLTKTQVRKGFYGQQDTRAKAIYLFTATTGLRKGEILSLNKENIDFETRAVIPKHYTRKKRSGITFYNKEAEKWLQKYLNERGEITSKIFPISDRKWREIWRSATEFSETRITAKILRLWFSTEMGELGVPDRYVDIFQGRAPRTVIAKHYTGTRLERLKRIYDKARLTVLK